MIRRISAEKRFVLAVLAVVVISAGTALAQNSPPVADAGPDQTLFQGESTVLDGTATDPDGDPIVFWMWTLESAPSGSAATISDRFRPNPLFIPDLLGEYFLSFVVSDGTDDSLPDTVTIIVVENLPPTAVATADVTSGEAPL